MINVFTILIFIFTCILVVTSLFLGWKIKNLSVYWLIALIGATILVLINVNNFSSVFERLVSNSAINPLKILIFFISMTILSLVLDKLNFFKYLALKCTKLAKTSQIKLFLIFYIFVSILTIFTSNDIVILSFVPFICYFCKETKIDPKPYVFSTFVGANTWSMFFIIGNPTNVYISTFAGLDFFTYFKTMFFPTIISGVVSLLLILLIFKKSLKNPINIHEYSEEKIDKPIVILNVSFLLMCIILLAISSYIKLEMCYIALGFVIIEIITNLIICLKTKRNKKYILDAAKGAPWAFIPFLLSMFLMVQCLNVNGVTAKLAEWFNLLNPTFSYGIFSLLFSNFMNNIPMTTLFASILSNGGVNVFGVYATIIGSNLGALLTPVGALAGIMFINILKEKDVNFTVKDFIKYGSIITIATALASLTVLQFVLA